MAKISDEIREFIGDEDLYPRHIAWLRRIADRIDAEMVELPRDADGVPIHVGDTVYLEDGRMAEAYSIKFKNCETNVLCRTPSGCYGYVYRLPNKLTHTRPDSLERIADELDAWCDRVDVDGDACDRPRDLADRIRKLAKEQGNE